jgi:AcrR family transcriptional regulator
MVRLVSAETSSRRPADDAPRPVAGRPDRAARSELRRAQVLEAALACFIERGYTASTMEDIRHASGVSIGSIYHHFGSKEELAVALHREYLKRWWALSERVIRPGRSARSVVKDLIDSYLRWVEQEPGLIRFMFFLPESLQIRAVAREELREEFTAGQTEIWSWLEAQAERGTIRRLPMDLYHAVIFGPMLEHVGRWLRGVADTGLTDAGPLLGESIWRSLRAGR